MNWNDFELWGTRIAGIIGAIVSMRFVEGTFKQRVIMAIGGAAFAFYATDVVTAHLSMPEGLAGFLLGLFGMSILSRMWEWAQTTNVLDWILNLLIRMRGK